MESRNKAEDIQVLDRYTQRTDLVNIASCGADNQINFARSRLRH